MVSHSVFSFSHLFLLTFDRFQIFLFANIWWHILCYRTWHKSFISCLVIFFSGFCIRSVFYQGLLVNNEIISIFLNFICCWISLWKRWALDISEITFYVFFLFPIVSKILHLWLRCSMKQKKRNKNLKYGITTICKYKYIAVIYGILISD